VKLKAPFTYHGGKSTPAPLIWQALGDCPSYHEWFGGSAAVLFARPHRGRRRETLNDKNGFVLNVWRSIKHDPNAVLNELDAPPSELELRARAIRLLDSGDALADKLWSDPEAHDAELAAWWIYGQCIALDADWMRTVAPTTRKSHFTGAFGLTFTPESLIRISERLRHVHLPCGDWERLSTPTSLGLMTTGTTPSGVFLDPPYPDEAIDYGSEPDTARKVEQWCRENGTDSRLRIVLCGHSGDYDLPGWRILNWGGSRGHGRGRRGENECLWLSPHCLTVSKQPSLFEVNT